MKCSLIKLSIIRNVDFLSFGVRSHISEKLVYIEIEVGRIAFLIWIKDRTFVTSSVPKFIASIDNDGGL